MCRTITNALDMVFAPADEVVEWLGMSNVATAPAAMVEAALAREDVCQGLYDVSASGQHSTYSILVPELPVYRKLLKRRGWQVRAVRGTRSYVGEVALWNGTFQDQTSLEICLEKEGV